MLSALPTVASAYRLYGDAAGNPLHRETLQLVSLLEQLPDHPAATEARSQLERAGVVVPIRRGQLALALAGSTTAHYDALILDQQHHIVAWTPNGFGPVNKRSGRPKEHHSLPVNEAREKLAAFNNINDAFLCPNEFHSWRRRALLRSLNALYVDVDFHNEGSTPAGTDQMQMVAEERIGWLERVGFPLPSLLVYSGRGFHFYWSHLPLPETELARWSEVQRWLQVMLDSDPRATDPTRYLRLIGTVHGKTGGTVTAERIGPSYQFEALYRGFLMATGRDQEVLSPEDDVAALELAQEEEGEATSLTLPGAAIHDLNTKRSRAGLRPHLQRGIAGWFDLVYRDIRTIIEYHGWKGQVPEGNRNTLLFHLAVSLAWITRSEALDDEVARENAQMVGLPTRQAKSITSSIVKRARDTQRVQAEAAKKGDLRYRLSRRTLWRDLSPLVPEELVERLRAVIPDDVWRARRQERQQQRNRIAEGRYEYQADALRRLQGMRREIAALLHLQGYGWSSIGEHLGISADAARKLASRAC